MAEVFTFDIDLVSECIDDLAAVKSGRLAPRCAR
jgi:hypothetical protein